MLNIDNKSSTHIEINGYVIIDNNNNVAIKDRATHKIEDVLGHLKRFLNNEASGIK